MSQPDVRTIRQTLREHFRNSLADTIDLNRVAWENRRFTPPPPQDSLGNPNYWIRETVHIIKEGPRAFGLLEIIGRTIFEVVYPVGKGTEFIEDLCQKIADAFEKKYSLNLQSLPVGIEEISRLNGHYIHTTNLRDAEPIWWAEGVSINWRSYSDATDPSAQSFSQ